MNGIKMRKLFIEQINPKIIKEDHTGKIVVSDGVFWIWIPHENINAKLSAIKKEDDGLEKEIRDRISDWDALDRKQIFPMIMGNSFYSLTNPAYLDSKLVMSDRNTDKYYLISSKYMMLANMTYPECLYNIIEHNGDLIIIFTDNSKVVAYAAVEEVDIETKRFIKHMELAKRLAIIENEEKE